MRVFPFQQLGEAWRSRFHLLENTDLLVGDNYGDRRWDYSTVIYFRTRNQVAFVISPASRSCANVLEFLSLALDFHLEATVERGFCIFHIKWWFIIEIIIEFIHIISILYPYVCSFLQFCIIFDPFPAIGSWGQWNCVALWRVWKIPQDPQQWLGVWRWKMFYNV